MGGELTQFISAHGVWLVAAFIALETVGAPLPAEAFLIAAAIFAASTQDIGWLIGAGILAAIFGNVIGFWIGRRFGYRLLTRHGGRLGLTADRIKIGQWLFLRYGGAFVFVARFLPFLRNMAAILAGANAMPQHTFYVASSVAAVVWVTAYGLGGYWFGEAFRNSASPAVIVSGVIAIAIIVAIPTIIVRYEKRFLSRAKQELSGPGVIPGPERSEGARNP
jgi:membrane protein DedA with SNARE-associated domain